MTLTINTIEKAWPVFGRRALLAGAASVFTMAFGAEAFAQETTSQAEWRQNYETASNLTVQRSVTPILSQQTVAATQRRLAGCS